MSWVLTIWTGIFLAGIISGIASRPSQDCPPGDQFCVNLSDAGTGIGAIEAIEHIAREGAPGWGRGRRMPP